MATGIQYSQSFEEWSAAHWARLDLEKWDSPGVYSPRFKGKVIAFYRLSHQVETHTQDAISRKMAKKKK